MHQLQISFVYPNILSTPFISCLFICNLQYLLLLFFKIQMSTQFCMSCSSTIPSQLLHLVCDHVLCTTCANELKTLEPNTPIQPKYKVLCPNCAKATITYDIQNLLFKTKTDHVLLQDLENSQLKQSSFVEEQPINLEQNYKEMSYSERINNLTNMSRKQSQTPDITTQKRAFNSSVKAQSKYDTNRASKISNREEDYSSFCKQHGQSLMFYCENQNKLLCIECMYKHTRQHKNHKVLSIKHAMGIISKQSGLFKEQTKIKMQQINRYITITKSNKKILQDKYKLSMQILTEEFESLEFMLKARETMLKDTLKRIFRQQQKEFENEISDLTNLNDCLKQYIDFEIEEMNSKIYFFYSYSQLKEAMSHINLKVYPISPRAVNLINRKETEEIKIAIEKLFQLPKEKERQEKDRSKERHRNLRSQSRGEVMHHTAKNTIALNEQIRYAKKKLENLQKIKKSNKTNHYLNMYLSNSPSGRESQKQRKSVQVQGERKITGRVLMSTRMVTKIKKPK